MADRAPRGAEQARLKAASRRVDRLGRSRYLGGGERPAAGDVCVIPGVVADHVAVGEHPTINRLAVGANLLADLEEGRVHVLALEDREELRRGGPRPVVERERDDASARGTVVDERGAVGDAADKLWRMKRRKLGLDREENRAAERIGRRGSAGGGFQGAEDLPAQRAVANPDVCGQERGGQVLVAGARDCRVDVVAGPWTVAQHVQVLESCPPGAPGRLHAQHADDRRAPDPLDHKAQRTLVAFERGGRERVPEVDTPDEASPVLDQRRAIDGQGRVRLPGRCGRRNEQRHHKET